MVFRVSAASLQALTIKPVPLTHNGPLQVMGVLTPSQMMRGSEGIPFTVPAWKTFVVTRVVFEDLTRQAALHGSSSTA